MSTGAGAMSRIDRLASWEVRDIALDKARFTGRDELSFGTSVSTGGELADYSVSLGADYTGVRYLAGQAVPTLGTISFTLNIDRTRGDDVRVFNSTAVLTYGGNAAPTTLAIDGSVTYNIDVATGIATRL